MSVKRHRQRRRDLARSTTGDGAGQRGHDAACQLAADALGDEGKDHLRSGLSPPAVVATRHTPAMPVPISSGCSSASAMIVMPPIE
jgi:hypothetical protein